MQQGSAPGSPGHPMAIVRHGVKASDSDLASDEARSLRRYTTPKTSVPEPKLQNRMHHPAPLDSIHRFHGEPSLVAFSDRHQGRLFCADRAFVRDARSWDTPAAESMTRTRRATRLRDLRLARTLRAKHLFRMFLDLRALHTRRPISVAQNLERQYLSPIITGEDRNMNRIRVFL